MTFKHNIFWVYKFKELDIAIYRHPKIDESLESTIAWFAALESSFELASMTLTVAMQPCVIALDSEGNLSVPHVATSDDKLIGEMRVSTNL